MTEHDTLINLYLDGELDEAQHAQLEQWLLADVEHRRQFAEWAFEDRYLYDVQMGEPSAYVADSSMHSETLDASLDTQHLSRPKSLLQRASRHPKGPAIAIAVAVIAAILLTMAATPVGKWIAGEGGKGVEERQPEGPPDSEFVAILNSRHDAVWLEDSEPSLSDPRLEVGRKLALKSGMIEVKYHTGAIVVIEGPAEFVVGQKDEGGRMKAEESEGHPSSFILHPSNTGFLRLGKLVARVEGKEAQGFTIGTPSARIEDLGTEFGVEVDEHGATKFVVLSGMVDVVSDDGEGPGQRVRLTKDQGAFIATAGGGITRRNKVDMQLAAAMRSRLEVIGRVPTGPIFREGFSRTTYGTDEGTQFQTGLDLRVGNEYPGWTFSGKSHAVDLDPTRRRNWAAMIWNDHSLTSPAIPANEKGTTYRVDFDGGPGVYADDKQTTASEERIKFEVLKGSGEVIHTAVYDPTNWGPPATGPSLLTLAPHSFTYIGDGNGHVRLRISPVANNPRFSGTIDNLSVSVETEGNVSSESGSEADGEATKETDSAEQGIGE